MILSNTFNNRFEAVLDMNGYAYVKDNTVNDEIEQYILTYNFDPYETTIHEIYGLINECIDAVLFEESKPYLAKWFIAQCEGASEEEVERLKALQWPDED